MLDIVVEIPPKRKKPKSENRTEGFYGPNSLWDRIERIAKDLGRPKSELVVGILQQWVAAYEADHPKQKQ